MFKYNLLLFTLISLVVAILPSCGSDPEPRTSIFFASGNSLVTQNQSVTGGQVFSTSVYAESGVGNQLKNFKITCIYDSIARDTIVYLDSTLQASEFGLVFTFATRNLNGKETWIYSVKDEKDVEASRRYTLTTTSTVNVATQPFYNFSSYFYHKSALDNLQYFALQDGSAYPGYAVRNNAALKSKVDFYFNEDAAKVISVQALTGTDTKFKNTALTTTEFSDTRTLAALQAIFNNSNAASENALFNLRKNQIIAFKSKNRTGIMRITAIEKTFDAVKNDSTLVQMRYDVKTEK